MFECPSSFHRDPTYVVIRTIDDVRNEPGESNSILIPRDSSPKPPPAASRQQDPSVTCVSISATWSLSSSASSISSSSSTADVVVQPGAQGDLELEREQQRQSTSALSPSQHHESSGSRQQQPPYEELVIRDGPLYSAQAPSRNSSSEYLLDYGRNVIGDAIVSGPDDIIQCGAAIVQNGTDMVNQFLPRRPSPMPAETTALLIVDVQPEYWSNCPAVRKDFPDFPRHLYHTIDVCRRRRAKIIWVRADYRYSHSPWLMQFERMRGQRNLGEVPCDPTSPEVTWENFAKPQGGEVIIAKSSWSSTSNTALMDILRAAGIETVLVCGLITSVCVQHSAFGVFEAGYRTVLVTDACADRGRARHEAALALYGDYMYELVTSDDLESEEYGLIPAEPVWLVMDAKTKMVRAEPYPKQPLYPSSSSSSSSSSSTRVMASASSSAVSPTAIDRAGDLVVTKDDTDIAALARAIEEIKERHVHEQNQRRRGDNVIGGKEE
jgi:nicotinamidase-related amidase